MQAQADNEPRIALVTGAAGALGAAISRALLGDGHRVVLADQDETAVNALAAELGSETLPVAFDVSDEKQLKMGCDRVRREWGCVDVLVNNAGVLSNNKLAGTSPDEWRRILA